MSGTDCAAAPTRVLPMPARVGPTALSEEEDDSEICSIFSPSQCQTSSYAKNLPPSLCVPCESLFPSAASKENAENKNQAGLHAEGVQMLNQTAGQQQQQSGNSSGSRASPTRLPAYSALWESSGQGENGAAASSATVVPQALNILRSQALPPPASSSEALGGPTRMAPAPSADPTGMGAKTSEGVLSFLPPQAGDGAAGERHASESSCSSFGTDDRRPQEAGSSGSSHPHGTPPNTQVSAGSSSTVVLDVTAGGATNRRATGNLTPGPSSSTKSFFPRTATAESGSADPSSGSSGEMSEAAAAQQVEEQEAGITGLGYLEVNGSSQAGGAAGLPQHMLMSQEESSSFLLQQLASPNAFMRYGFTLDGALAAQREAEQQAQQQQQQQVPQQPPSSEQRGPSSSSAPRAGGFGGARLLSGVDTSWSVPSREAIMSPHTMQVSRMLEALNVDGDDEAATTAGGMGRGPQSQQPPCWPMVMPQQGPPTSSAALCFPVPSSAPQPSSSAPIPAPSSSSATAAPFVPPYFAQQQQQQHARAATGNMGMSSNQRMHPQQPPLGYGAGLRASMPSASSKAADQARGAAGYEPSPSSVYPPSSTGLSAEALASFDLLRQQLGNQDALALLLHLQRQQLQQQQQQQAQQQQFQREVLLQLQQHAAQQQAQQQQAASRYGSEQHYPRHHGGAQQPRHAASMQQQQQRGVPYPSGGPGPRGYGGANLPTHHYPHSARQAGGGYQAQQPPSRAAQQAPGLYGSPQQQVAGGPYGTTSSLLASAGRALPAERSMSDGSAPLPQQYHQHHAGHHHSNSAGSTSSWFSADSSSSSLSRAQSAGAGPWPNAGPPPTSSKGHVKGASSGGSAASSYMEEMMMMMGREAGLAGMGVSSSKQLDAMAAKRAELMESPTTRMQFKDFYRQFRCKERCSFEAAKEYAMACFDHLPKKVHWKLYLELADLAKRENRVDEARRLYKKVCRLQPHASQGWLEYSKMEEECGDLEVAARILKRGLVFCELSESLLARAIKHEERKKNIAGARELLARLKHVGIDKVWRTVLEGALLEARAGNNAVARKVFKYLMSHVPWYGPIYNEAFRLEEKSEHHASALAIVERGLKEIPRYGPLWFGAFRLCERLDLQSSQELVKAGRMPSLLRTRDAISRALSSISKELIWKVHFEAAQIEERAASMAATHRMQQLQQGGETSAAQRKETVAAIRHELLARCRRCYVEAVLSSPSNLRWKVWLAGARTELGTGRLEVARALLHRAFSEVPEKSKAHVFLECARLEEFAGNVDRARKILIRSRQETRAEWKVFLESVLLEMRAGQWGKAVEEAQSALKIHTGTGRLWAILVQLRYMDGDGEQLKVLKQALGEVPKSGEVWCEGARIHLSPLSRSFDLDTAEQYLDFAIQFTPQYGDSFLELLRLVLIREVIVPRAKRLMERRAQQAAKAAEQEGEGGGDVAGGKAKAEEAEDDEPAPDEQTFLSTDTTELELRCSNADPNYGMMWFHCRDMPSDTPRLLMRRAKLILSKDLAALYPLYLQAITRRITVEQQVVAATTSKDGEAGNKAVQKALREAEAVAGVAGLQLEPWDFVTGLVGLNRIASRISDLPDEDKRKMLFGSDQLVP